MLSAVKLASRTTSHRAGSEGGATGGWEDVSDRTQLDRINRMRIRVVFIQSILSILSNLLLSVASQNGPRPAPPFEVGMNQLLRERIERLSDLAAARGLAESFDENVLLTDE